MSLYNVDLDSVMVKAVRADMLKGRVTVTFEMALDEQIDRARRKLAILAVDQALVHLSIRERVSQLRMLSMTDDADQPSDREAEDGTE